MLKTKKTRLTKEQIKELANKYVNPTTMIWLVVGDSIRAHERIVLWSSYFAKQNFNNKP